MKSINGLQSELTGGVSIIPNKDIVNCYFIHNSDERIKRIIKSISQTEKRIYILSSLSSKKTTETSQHKNYLSALDKILKNKKNVDFLRIVISQRRLNNNSKNKQELINKIKEFEPYKEHFNNINKFREKSLIVLPDGPSGISILFIDDRFLFLIIEKNYKEKLLSELLEGGFFFENLSEDLVERFKRCFIEMKLKGEAIE